MNLTRGQRLIFSPGPRVTLEAFDVPAPVGQQVVVRVLRSQVSAGSEMNFLRHGPVAFGFKDPTVTTTPLGYMAVGRVSAIGPAVTGFKVGDRVLTNGPHGSHWLVDLANPGAVLERVPDGVSDEAAGFATLGAVALHGVRRAALQIDESVAVFGAGIVGQLNLQLARLSGVYPLIAVDLSDERLAHAKASGATHLINARQVDAVEAIRTITQGAGAEVVFQCTPVASMLPTVMKAAADRGKVIMTGSAPGVAQIGLQDELLRRELSIIGIYARGIDQPHPYWPWTTGRNRRACLRLLDSGGLRIDPLLTHVISPADAEKTFAMMLNGVESWLGVVVKWD